MTTTPTEKIQVAAVCIAAASFAGRELHAARLERKRSQPVVIAHEGHAPTFDGAAQHWHAGIRLTNDGGGSAFNIRYGIELRGVRFPYRADLEDEPENGTRLNVLAAGRDTPGVRWQISSGDFWDVAAMRTDGRLHTSRVYWCRYENASGDTWETRNPVDRSRALTIRRVRFSRLRDWRQGGKRKRVRGTLQRAVSRDLAAEKDPSDGGA